MGRLQDEMKIDPAEEEQKIGEFLVEGLKRLRKDGLVLGLSGGLDSSTCAYIAEKTLGKKNVFTLILPEKDSSPVNTMDARLVANNLKLEVKEIDITRILDEIGVYEGLPGGLETREKIESLIKYLSAIIRTPSIFTSGISLLYGETRSIPEKVASKLLAPYVAGVPAFAFTKIRLRMLILYFYAMRKNFALCGTTDKSEWSIGFFDRYGDGAHDISLLRHLYKTQIRQLAQHVRVPKAIIEKPSSGDVIAQLPNEVVIGLSYEQLDQVLYGFERGLSDETIVREVGVPRKALQYIRDAMATTKKRMALPLALD